MLLEWDCRPVSLFLGLLIAPSETPNVPAVL